MQRRTVVAAGVSGVDRAVVVVSGGASQGVLVEALLGGNAIGVFHLVSIANEELEVALFSVWGGVGRVARVRARGHR